MQHAPGWSSNESRSLGSRKQALIINLKDLNVTGAPPPFFYDSITQGRTRQWHAWNNKLNWEKFKPVLVY